MLAAATQAFRQLFTPPFRAVLLKCIGFTIGLLTLLNIMIEAVFGHFVDWPHWIETTVEWLGGLALVVGSIFLIPPVTSLMAGLFLDDIANEVERVYYPSDPPGRELSALAAIGVGMKFFVAVLGVNLIALFLLLVPGINLIAFYVGNGYLLGREYFEMVALRHLPLEEARRLRNANMVYVSLCGLIIAGLASVPILNLLTPLFATAFMVHIYKSLARPPGWRAFPLQWRQGVRLSDRASLASGFAAPEPSYGLLRDPGGLSAYTAFPESLTAFVWLLGWCQARARKIERGSKSNMRFKSPF